MKCPTLIIAFLSSLIFLGSMTQIQAQNIADNDTSKTYLIVKNDGTRYVGKIISQDAREVQIVTKEIGELIIPKHEIKEIRALKDAELTPEGTLRPAEVFSTRYFITTNGLNLHKGDTYIIWNLYGPDIQFGVKDNLSLGVMTSWFGSPVIGSIKYSIPLGENRSIGLGTLLGTGSWASPEYGVALPYGTVTFGDATININLSAGYGTAWGGGYSGGRAIFSVGGMSAINDKLSFVFDSFIVSGMGADDGGALIIPGMRLQTSPDKAFQLGFAGVAADGELVPFPLPMIQWFRKL